MNLTKKKKTFFLQELFANEMKKHDEIVGFIKQNCRAQENLIQAMTEANADLADRRSTMIKAFERFDNESLFFLSSKRSFRYLVVNV